MLNIKIMEKSKCNSKDQLITLLKDWLKTNEPTIGNRENKTGNTIWIVLNLNGSNYYINGDSKRDGILNLVKNHENNYPWVVIANNRGVYKKVSNDVNGNAIKGLYFYSVIIGKREI
jgi:hypothetical protein